MAREVCALFDDSVSFRLPEHDLAYQTPAPVTDLSRDLFCSTGGEEV